MARILIAEDDPHISRVIALWLKRNGHEVIEATSGDKALSAIRKEAPDLLVTDVNMPGMDGIELLEAVRAESLIDHKAIVLTSRCDQAEIEVFEGQIQRKPGIGGSQFPCRIQRFGPYSFMLAQVEGWIGHGHMETIQHLNGTDGQTQKSSIGPEVCKQASNGFPAVAGFFFFHLGGHFKAALCESHGLLPFHHWGRFNGGRWSG